MKTLDEAALRQRFDDGESTAVLADEVGLSRVQLWRRIGRPARYQMGQPTGVPTEAIIAWAAGFFDGEGNVSITPDGHLRASAAQVVAEPLFELHEVFGGTVRERAAPSERHRDQWIWGVSGAAALRFLQAIRPYLRVKGPQAALAISALIHRPPRRGHALGAWERAERGSYYLAMLELNSGKGRRSPNQHR